MQISTNLDKIQPLLALEQGSGGSVEPGPPGPLPLPARAAAGPDRRAPQASPARPWPSPRHETGRQNRSRSKPLEVVARRFSSRHPDLSVGRDYREVGSERIRPPIPPAARDRSRGLFNLTPRQGPSPRGPGELCRALIGRQVTVALRFRDVHNEPVRPILVVVHRTRPTRHAFVHRGVTDRWAGSRLTGLDA